MAVRIFLALVVRNHLRDESEEPRTSLIYRMMNEASVYFAVAEVLSQGMFAIVTIRFDFPELYRYSFTIFVLCSAIYMVIRTVLTFSISRSDSDMLDTMSIIIKGFSTFIYFWAISRFYWVHLTFIVEPACHGYGNNRCILFPFLINPIPVPPLEAFIEYLVIATYMTFHLTMLIDIRDIRFICYPRTCSGECEPLKPENFAKNGKFEFCRSYELRQRQVLGLEKDHVINERF